MNYIDLVLIIFTVICIYIGVKRGLFLSLLGMIRALLGVPLSFYIGETYAQTVYENYVRQTILNTVEEQIAESGAYESISSTVSQLKESFPFLFSGDFSFSSLAGINSESLAVYITDELIAPTALEIVKIILILLSLLLFYLITGIIIRLIKKLRAKRNLPFRRTNNFLGGAFAALKACVILFALSAFSYTVIGFGYEDNAFISQLQNSTIISFINEFNPLI